jgi:hypothetical protein
MVGQNSAQAKKGIQGGMVYMLMNGVSRRLLVQFIAAFHHLPCPVNSTLKNIGIIYFTRS